MVHLQEEHFLLRFVEKEVAMQMIVLELFLQERMAEIWMYNKCKLVQK